jgi:hypothetical protein
MASVKLQILYIILGCFLSALTALSVVKININYDKDKITEAEKKQLKEDISKKASIEYVDKENEKQDEKNKEDHAEIEANYKSIQVLIIETNGIVREMRGKLDIYIQLKENDKNKE